MIVFYSNTWPIRQTKYLSIHVSCQIAKLIVHQMYVQLLWYRYIFLFSTCFASQIACVQYASIVCAWIKDPNRSCEGHG